jgi:hypothetical protein
MTLSDTKQTIATTPAQRGNLGGQAVGFIYWSLFATRTTVKRPVRNINLFLQTYRCPRSRLV